MADANRAVLSSEGDMTSFTIGDLSIRFKTSEHLVRYESITEWDSGYIACMARYESPECVEEEYIDLVPILRNLYLDPDRVLRDIKEVTIEYV